MKKQYVRPLAIVEHYALTQSIASCVGIKILNGPGNGSQDVLDDPHAPNSMKSWAQIGGFLSWDGCTIAMEFESGDDGACYHSNVNAAFNS